MSKLRAYALRTIASRPNPGWLFTTHATDIPSEFDQQGFRFPSHRWPTHLQCEQATEILFAFQMDKYIVGGHTECDVVPQFAP